MNGMNLVFRVLCRYLGAGDLNFKALDLGVEKMRMVWKKQRKAYPTGAQKHERCNEPPENR
jgi:hypothetical protein